MSAMRSGTERRICQSSRSGAQGDHTEHRRNDHAENEERRRIHQNKHRRKGKEVGHEERAEGQLDRLYGGLPGVGTCDGGPRVHGQGTGGVMSATTPK